MSKEQYADDGGFAFPLEFTFTNREGKEEVTSHGGLSLRDYFAAKAMQGWCAADDAHGTVSGKFSDLANDAYRMADEMIKARKKKVRNENH